MVAVDGISALMFLVQIEDMISRCQDHFLILCKDDSLQDINHLGNIGHNDTLTVPIENI